MDATAHGYEAQTGLLRIPPGLLLLGEWRPRRRSALRRSGPRCRICGCVEVAPCPGGCGWESGDRDLCTACGERVVALTAPDDRELVAAAAAAETMIAIVQLAAALTRQAWRRSRLRERIRELLQEAGVWIVRP